MKKYITIIATITLLAISCQKENTPVDRDSNNPVNGKLTATIAKTSTKVILAETTDHNLQPAWEIGDEIIGFDDEGSTYTLIIASVSEETATLEGTVPDGALHLIYKSGAKASDISSNTLAIDYTDQACDNTIPAVMLADGTVENGSCEFSFNNAGAIIGISAVNGVPSGATISKITIEGENLSEATVSLNGSALALTATEKTDDVISVADLNLTVTDANGTLSNPIFVAVPAGATITKVNAIVTKEPETMTKPSATPQEGVDYVTIGGVKWAKWNVGASSETDSGWYFPWAGTEGYFRYADTWQSVKATSIEFSYSPTSAHTATASDYLYVKEQVFKAIGHSFDWANTPYQTQGNVLSASSTKFTKYSGSNLKDPSATDEDASKTVLDQVDDAAYVNWSGTWRMPTDAELKALKTNTTQTFKKDYNGTGIDGYLFTSKQSGEAGHSIFMPCAGCGKGLDWTNDNIQGYYWSSSLNTMNQHQGLTFGFKEGSVNESGFGDGFVDPRSWGQSIRPVLK